MKQPILLMTRPDPGAIRFVNGLRPEVLDRVRVVISPLISIVPTGAAPEVTRYSGVIFTSRHGVGLARDGQGHVAYCVGGMTGTAAKERGWDVRLVRATAMDLIAAMRSLRVDGPLVHLAGRHRQGKIAETLTEAGTRTEEVTLYDQMLQPLNAEAKAVLASDNAVVAPLFSARTASHFVTEVDRAVNVHLVCISDAVAREVQGTGAASVTVSPEPSGQEMAGCVEKLLCRNGLA